MGNRLVQILQQFAHTGHRDAKGLNKQEQLLRLKVLQRCEMEKSQCSGEEYNKKTQSITFV